MSDEFMSFDNKITFLHNPLPPITVEELHKRAGLINRKRKQAARKVFELELRWGGGEDLKTHTLSPGRAIRMEERRAKEIIEDFKPVGGAICGSNPGLAFYNEEEDKLRASIDALHIAEAHYHTIGAGQVDGVRASRGHSDADLARYKDSIYLSYNLAMAKEAVIRETREKLEQKLTEKNAQREADKQRVANGRG